MYGALQSEAERDERRKTMYGGGFTYGFSLVDDPTINRTALLHRVKAHEFDFVVYFFSRADTSGALLWFDDVAATYAPEEIVLIDSFDAYDHWCEVHKLWCSRAWRRRFLIHKYALRGTVFRREET